MERLALSLPEEPSVNEQTHDGPKQLGQTKGHSVSHSQKRTITERSEGDDPGSLEGSKVLRDGKGQ